MPLSNPIFAAAIGAILGAVATHVSSLWLRHKRNRREVENLRTALKEELEALGLFMESMSETIRDQERGVRMAGTTFISSIDPVVFRSNADKIGMLSRDEVKKITECYTTVRTVGNMMNALAQREMNAEQLSVYLPDDSHSEEIEELLEGLDGCRLEAIEAIDRHLE